MISATKRLMLQFSGMLLRHGYVWNVFGNRKIDTWGCGQIVGPNRFGYRGADMSTFVRKNVSIPYFQMRSAMCSDSALAKTRAIRMLRVGRICLLSIVATLYF